MTPFWFRLQGFSAEDATGPMLRPLFRLLHGEQTRQIATLPLLLLATVGSKRDQTPDIIELEVLKKLAQCFTYDRSLIALIQEVYQSLKTIVEWPIIPNDDDLIWNQAVWHNLQSIHLYPFLTKLLARTLYHGLCLSNIQQAIKQLVERRGNLNEQKQKIAALEAAREISPYLVEVLIGLIERHGARRVCEHVVALLQHCKPEDVTPEKLLSLDLSTLPAGQLPLPPASNGNQP